MSGDVDRLLAAVSAGDVAAVTAMFAPDGVLELSPGARRWSGHSEIAPAAATLAGAFAGLTWIVMHRWVEFSRVIEEGVWEGVHVGPLPGWTGSGTGTHVRLRARAVVEHGPGGLRRLRFSTDLPGLQFALGLGDRPAGPALTSSSPSPLTSPAPRPAGEPERSWDGAEGSGGTGVLGRERVPHRAALRRPSFTGLSLGIIGLVFTVAVGVLGFLGWTTLMDRVHRSAGAASAGSTALAVPPSLAAGPAAADRGSAPSASSGVTRHGRDLDLSTDVLFHSGSAVLDPSARGAIREVARILQVKGVRDPVQINGYTDDIASAGYNRQLSRRRAQAVQVALQHLLGPAAPPLAAHGYGMADPVASNATGAGRARNRRVTIVLPS